MLSNTDQFIVLLFHNFLSSRNVNRIVKAVSGLVVPFLVCQWLCKSKNTFLFFHFSYKDLNRDQARLQTAVTVLFTNPKLQNFFFRICPGM